MEAVIDSMGRIVIPKPWRTAYGFTPGTKVDISLYGSGIQVIPGGRAARVEREDGRLVIVGETVLTDEAMFALIDAGRK